ncbi:DUF2690 domain-containing protein [Streptomyces sp. NPDC093568]|uniref:helix-turn-helix domain-containing protein n=1 Tax=Streptomyces sp. NPDC093568 TaxID=3366041 RepID=UPI003810861E
MTAPSPERARLATVLRELKGRTGLSLAGLAAKTAFSKSSWDRYLNARTLPPRDAVRELCRLAGEPEGRCVALWEIAESEGSGRAAQGPRTPSPRTPSPRTPSPRTPSPRTPSPRTPPASAPAPAEESPHTGRGRDAQRGATLVAVLASVSAVVVGGVAAVVLLLPYPDGEPSASLSAPPSAAAPLCREAGCEGRSPMLMKCASVPDTLASYRTATGAWLELRYSRACGTSWAGMRGTRVGDRLEVSARGGEGGESHGRVRGAETRDGVDAHSYVYTPMTASRPGTVVRACFLPAEGGGTECFGGTVLG